MYKKNSTPDQSNEKRSFDVVVNTARNTISKALVNDGVNVPYYPVHTYPITIDSKHSWSTFSYTSSEGYFEKATLKPFIGTGGIMGLSQVPGIPGESRDNLNVASVQFEYTRVRLERSWLDTTLLYSRMWWFPGMTKANPVSNPIISFGNLENQGMWSLTPQEMIITRNLRIEVDSSEINTLNEVFGAPSPLFWNFPLQRTDVYSGAQWSKSASTTMNRLSQTLLAQQGMQIAAFICNINEKLPDTDPVYLPD